MKNSRKCPHCLNYNSSEVINCNSCGNIADIREEYRQKNAVLSSIFM